MRERLLLIGAPFAALVTGAWLHGMARQAQLAQEASRRQVTAVVLSVAPLPAGDGRLAWQAQAGGRHPVAGRSPMRYLFRSARRPAGRSRYGRTAPVISPPRRCSIPRWPARRLPGKYSGSSSRPPYSAWPGSWPAGHSTGAGWPPGTRTGTRRARAGQPAPEGASRALRDEGPARTGHPAVATRPASRNTQE